MPSQAPWGSSRPSEATVPATEPAGSLASRGRWALRTPPREAGPGQVPRWTTAASRPPAEPQVGPGPQRASPQPRCGPWAECQRHFVDQRPGAAERGRGLVLSLGRPCPPAGLLPTQTPLGGRQMHQTRPRHRTTASAGCALPSTCCVPDAQRTQVTLPDEPLAAGHVPPGGSEPGKQGGERRGSVGAPKGSASGFFLFLPFVGTGGPSG